MLSSIPINLIRQWCYCPRVVYYMKLLELKVETPGWVKQGTKFHELEEKLWKRRDLSRFNLSEGTKHHNVNMRSDKLGLHGIADMVIETSDSIYPVEFKISTKNAQRGSVLQLASYAMLCEDHFGKKCEVGFLVGKGNILHKIFFDEDKREQVANVIKDIKKMFIHGNKPDSDASVTQCSACEYVNFCNDRL